MSTTGADQRPSAAGLVLAGLIALSVWWPAPVVWINEMSLDLPLRIDQESFLGREAAEWDLVFWWLAGVCGLSIGWTDRERWRTGLGLLGDELRDLPHRVRGNAWGPAVRRGVATGLVLIGAAAAIDAPVMNLLITTDPSGHDFLSRPVNRLGGGIVPSLVACYIGLTGLSRPAPPRVRLFATIVGASILSGLALHALKLIGRVRPELFFGPLSFEPGQGSSFPSGHALSAFVICFAVAGALGHRHRHWTIPVILIPVAVSAARVVTFRHWPSDVVASAALAGVAVALARGGIDRRAKQSPSRSVSEENEQRRDHDETPD